MKRRLRVFAKVFTFWNPCIWAGDVDVTMDNQFLAALELVSTKVPQIRFSLEDA